MDAMYTDNFEVDHLASCGCDDSGVTFDPSGELAPPLPPVDVDVQPDASYDVMGLGQPGSTDVSYDVAPDVTAIPTPDAPPPAPLADAPADDCGPPPAPSFSVEGEGSFDVTGLGQPGHPDVAPDTSIDVIGLGQPGNDATVAPETTISFDGGQPLDEPLVITDAAPSADPTFTTSVIGGDSIDTTVGTPSFTTTTIGGGFVLGDAVHQPSPSPAVVGGYLLDTSGMGSSPVPGMYQLLNLASDPITKMQILGMINSQNHMTDVWLSDFTASII
jgi:hypothetical protein